MRRAIALSLLTIFSWMLIAPIFGPDAEASLPPCCRRHGKHHCIMQRLLALSGVPGGPPVVHECCPCQPCGGGAAHSRVYTTDALRRLQAVTVQPASLQERSQTTRQPAFFDSHPKRGPPTNLA
jgi:hypothetical protein